MVQQHISSSALITVQNTCFKTKCHEVAEDPYSIGNKVKTSASSFSCLLHFFFGVLIVFTDSCYLHEKSWLFLPYSFVFFHVFCLTQNEPSTRLCICLKLNIHIKDFGIGPGFKASCGINHLLYNIKPLLLYIRILSYLGQKGFLCSDFLLNTITRLQL